MKTERLSQPALMEKAIEALVEKLGISQASEFWSSLNFSQKDYTRLRKKMFKEETVEGLYRKIKKTEEQS